MLLGWWPLHLSQQGPEARPARARPGDTACNLRPGNRGVKIVTVSWCKLCKNLLSMYSRHNIVQLPAIMLCVCSTKKKVCIYIYIKKKSGLIPVLGDCWMVVTVHNIDGGASAASDFPASLTLVRLAACPSTRRFRAVSDSYDSSRWFNNIQHAKWPENAASKGWPSPVLWHANILAIQNVELSKGLEHIEAHHSIQGEGSRNTSIA